MAIVFSPVVDAFERRHVPRLLGATAVLLGLLAFAAPFACAIVRVILDQAPQITVSSRPRSPL